MLTRKGNISHNPIPKVFPSGWFVRRESRNTPIHPLAKTVNTKISKYNFSDFFSRHSFEEPPLLLFILLFMGSKTPID